MKRFFIKQTPLSSASGWFIPCENLMLIFDAAGHHEFIEEYLEKDKTVTDKKINEILKDTREEINTDYVEYVDLFKLGWIRFYVNNDYINIESRRNPVNDIADLVKVLADYGERIEVETDRGFATFKSEELPGRKELAQGLAGRYSKIAKKLKNEGKIVSRSVRIARKMLGL